MLKFFFDTHIAKAAAVQLQAKGVDTLRCEDVGMAEASDEALLQYATEHGRVMVSQDGDFAALHDRWLNGVRSHAGIIKVSKRYQGAEQISQVVQNLIFYNEAAIVGAVDYESEIANHIIYI